jgi:superfamily II DNA or RNA helicase
MSDVLEVYKKDEVYLKIDCDRGTAMELSQYFTFEVPGAKFIPSVRNKLWDGKIRLFNVNTRQIYVGLIQHIIRFCKERDYEINIHDGILDTQDVPINKLEKFLEEKDYKPRDYQTRAIAHAIRNHRALILSPTASGKSFIIYSLLKYYLQSKQAKKALVIVPTTSLVSQMNSDFLSYSEGQFNYTHLIMAGQGKSHETAKVFISTWQSIYKQPKSYFDQFDLVIGDEAHLFKAASLTKIMEKLPDCKYRFGFTGTLDDTVTNKLVLEGLFGPVMKVIQTKELIDSGHLADFRIKALVLKYPPELCKVMCKAKYQDEIAFIVGNERRNAFIKNLTLTRKGNTLVLFQMVEKHGKVLYNMIKDEVAEGRHVFFVHGGIDADQREEVRRITEGERDAIIIASYGTFSTGVNIRNLHNVIFASPSKSRVRNLQSIGRGLRKGNGKDRATLYDIADDLHHKSSANHTLKHFSIRIKMYNEEEFEYKIYNIELKHDSTDIEAYKR